LEGFLVENLPLEGEVVEDVFSSKVAVGSRKGKLPLSVEEDEDLGVCVGILEALAGVVAGVSLHGTHLELTS